MGRKQTKKFVSKHLQGELARRKKGKKFKSGRKDGYEGGKNKNSVEEEVPKNDVKKNQQNEAEAQDFEAIEDFIDREYDDIIGDEEFSDEEGYSDLDEALEEEDSIEDEEMSGDEDEKALRQLPKKRPGKKQKVKHMDQDYFDALTEVINTKCTANAVKILVAAFRTCSTMDQENQVGFALEVVVNDSDIFNQILLFTFSKMPEIAQKLLNGVKASECHTHKNWPQFRPMLQSYFANTLRFLKKIQDNNMLEFIFEKLSGMMPYLAHFKSYLKQIIKVGLRQWQTSDFIPLKIQIFMFFHKLASADKTYIDVALKGLYLSYARYGKNYNWKNFENVIVMRNCVLELMNLDLNSAYKTLFVYMRQMSLQLRTVFNETQKTKEMIKAIYNWQFLNCLKLFAAAVAKFQTDGDTNLLVNPLLQICLAVLQVCQNSKYNPFKLHILRVMNQISADTKVYIPVVPHVISILQSPEIAKAKNPRMEKPVDFEVGIKVSKKEINTLPYIDNLVDNAISVLLEAFSLQSTNISFPELAINPLINMKKWVKDHKNPKVVKPIKQAAQKIQDNSDYIVKQRSKSKFPPTDLDSCLAFQKTITQAPLMKVRDEIIERRTKVEKQRVNAAIGRVEIVGQ